MSIQTNDLSMQTARAPSQRIRAVMRNHMSLLFAAAMLLVILMVYASLGRGVLTIEELNIDSAAALTLVLAATAQTIVMMRGGIDLSIGGIISLGTSVFATQVGDSAISVMVWSAIVLAGGALIGALNGWIMTTFRLQPFLVTLAMWSILSGVAMMVLPTDGGKVPGWWISFANEKLYGIVMPVWLIAALLLFWVWFAATRTGTTIKAVGSSAKAAYLSGVSEMRVSMVCYGLSGLFAAMAALYLTTQIGAGSPNIGSDYILASVAASVIGGVSLFGGRGHLLGTVIGAFILTIIGNLIFVLRISSFWQPVASGAILLCAVLVTSIIEKKTRASSS